MYMVEFQPLFLGLIGIGISVGTFIITYRQTIGARKERAKNVVSDVNKIQCRASICFFRLNYAPRLKLQKSRLA